MTQLDDIRAIANAILYEGYMLYPYRPSALKNQRPGWSFGTLLPPTYANCNPGESSFLAGQVLMTAAQAADLTVELRFLQLSDSTAQSSIERTVTSTVRVRELLDGGTEMRFSFGDNESHEKTVEGTLQLVACRVNDSAMRLTVQVHNRTRLPEPVVTRDRALQFSLVAAHAVLAINQGEFLSQLDTPEALREQAAACRQTGVFPVLVGKPGRRQYMLLSPIILYDYPQIAPESPGDFYDSSEIDELLTLRVLTLTEAEQDEMRRGMRTRKLLERTHSARSEDLLKMHGTIRTGRGEKEPA